MEIKKQFHKFIDDVPEAKLPSLYKLFLRMVDEESEHLTEKEKEDIKRARKDFENNDVYFFEDTF